MKPISLLGDIVVDLISDSGGYDFTPLPGGSIFNTACTLAKFGSPVSFYSAVGNDLWGNYLIDIMKELSIDSSRVIKMDSYKTSIAFARIEKEGNASYDFYKTDRTLTIKPEQLEESSIFHYGSFFALKKGSRKIIKNFLHKAEKNGLVISYDPNFRKNHELSNHKRDIISNFKHSHIIKASIEDLEHIFGVTKISDAFKILFTFNPILSIVTLGKRGAVASVHKKPFVEAEAEPVTVVDTVGAGDNFTAGVLSYLQSRGITTREQIGDLSKEQLLSLLEFANHTAGESLQTKGAQVNAGVLKRLQESFGEENE